jgi:hypothetical protein
MREAHRPVESKDPYASQKARPHSVGEGVIFMISGYRVAACATVVTSFFPRIPGCNRIANASDGFRIFSEVAHAMIHAAVIDQGPNFACSCAGGSVFPCHHAVLLDGNPIGP